MLEDVEPDEVLIAIPSAPGTLRARVVSACRERGIAGAHDADRLRAAADRRRGSSRQVREVRVEDVLGREPVRMEIERVGGYLTGRVRARHRRRRLDRRRAVPPDRARGPERGSCCSTTPRTTCSRSSASWWRTATSLNTVAVLADCKEEERMREVFAEHRPTVVFHAAAYKHVGLMEDNPVEAVRNNALATRVMARVAGDAGTQRVRARLDRQGGRARDRDGRVQGARRVGGRGRRRAAIPDTAFCAVRFGNVLGSSGSVVPIFRRQIAAGGPVTVTDPRDDALLHDDPGGGAARHPLGLAGAAAARCSCSRWASPVRIMDLAEGHDPLLRARARPRHRDRDHRPRGRARSCTRSCSTPTSARSRRRRRRSCAPRGPAVDPAWVEDDVRQDRPARRSRATRPALAAAVAELATGASAEPRCRRDGLRREIVPERRRPDAS